MGCLAPDTIARRSAEVTAKICRIRRPSGALFGLGYSLERWWGGALSCRGYVAPGYELVLELLVALERCEEEVLRCQIQVVWPG